MIELLEKKHVTVKEDQEKSLITVTWKGLTSSEEYRTIMQDTVNHAEKNGIKHWITDNTEARILRSEDQQWLLEKIIPQAKKVFDKACVIDSKDVFRKAGVTKIQKNSEAVGFEIRNFASLEEAHEWIG